LERLPFLVADAGVAVAAIAAGAAGAAARGDGDTLANCSFMADISAV